MWLADALDCQTAIQRAGLTRKETAARLGLKESQLSAQLKGQERPQTELFRYDDRLSGPYLIAQALKRPDIFAITTVLTVKGVC